MNAMDVGLKNDKYDLSRWSSLAFWFLSGLLFFAGTGCSSIYYFPTKNIYYVAPQKINPAPEIVSFTSTDGTKLEAWYFKTTHKKPKGFIIHFHGNAQNVSTHFTYLWKVGEVGYDYFVFDYRGFGKSEGTPTPAGVVQDGLAALKWSQAKMKERGISSLTVFCQSLGGAICAKTLSLVPEFPVDNVVIDSSFPSYRSVARSVAQSNWLLWVLQPVAWLIADNSQSPQDVFGDLKAKRFLVVHGDNDNVVSFRHGEKIFSLLPEPKEFWRISNGQHTDFLFIDEGKYRIKFYAWLDRGL